LKKWVYIFFFVLLYGGTQYESDYKDFELINPPNTTNIFGNFVVVGNTVSGVSKCKSLCKNDDDLDECEIFTDHNDIYYNNIYMVRYFNDKESNENLNKGSIAYLKLPPTAKKILWAALYWQGHINNYSYVSSNTPERENDKTNDKSSMDKYYAENLERKFFLYYKADSTCTGIKKYYNLSNDLPDNKSDGIKKTDANKIKLIIKDKTYSITADKLFYKGDSRYFCNKNNGCHYEKYEDADRNKDKDFDKLNGVKYAAYKVLDDEIISVLNDNITEIKNYGLKLKVSDLLMTQGLDARLGNYGAWSLVVIYSEDVGNSSSKLRSINIYTGFQNLSSTKQDININVNNLILPKHGNIESQMTVFAAEGEKSNTGDYVQVNDTNVTENFKDYDPNNVFDSYLSDDIKREPMIYNNNGIDIDIFDSSEALTKTRDSDENASSYSADIHVHTETDGIFIEMIAFATELYRPRICYYIDKIKDSEGNTVYENGEFKDGVYINPDEVYTFELWYANMKKDTNDSDIDDADKVKIYMNTKNFSYVPNSTEIKNVGSLIYKDQGDAVDDGDLFFYYPDENLSKYHVGDGADSDDGGELKVSTSYDLGTNKAYVRFKGKFLIESNQTQIDLNDVFKFRSSYKTNWLTIGDDEPQEIAKCIPFGTLLDTWIPEKGTFNAVEPQNLNSILNDGIDPLNPLDSKNNIYTKIVNKPFGISIVHLKDDNVTINNYLGLVRVSAIDATGAESISDLDSKPNLNYKFVIVFGTNKDINMTVPKAVKKAKIRISYFGGIGSLFSQAGNFINCATQMQSGPNVTLGCIWSIMEHEYNNMGNNIDSCINDPSSCLCANECLFNQSGSENIIATTLPNCLNCLYDRFGTHAYSRDSFAVRPAKFEIHNPPNVSKLKAGNEYTLIFKAVDENGSAVVDYNETLHLSSLSPVLIYSDKKSAQGCNTGALSFTDVNTTKFQNGVAAVKIKYSEVGELNMTIKELPGSEFAKIDANDTNSTLGRYILQDEKTIIYIPDHFSFSGINVSNAANGYTYMSNDLNMSGKMTYTITAKDSDGNTTLNYSSACYAKDVNITITHQSLNINEKMSYYVPGEGVVHQNIPNDKNITFKILKTNFTTGSTTPSLYLNFVKNYKKPVEPFTFTFNNIYAKDTDNITGSSPVNQSLNYIYGRINIPHVAGYSNVLYNRVTYEYYQGGKWIVNQNHISSAEGDINVSKTIIPGVSLHVDPINNGYQNIKYTALKTPPFTTKGDYGVSSWLWYHPKALNYQDPSATNHNCLTHPCNKINFLQTSNSWAGVGDDDSKYVPENNRSVRLKSKADVNVSKSMVKKLNW